MEFKNRGNKLYQSGKSHEAIAAYTKGIDLVEQQGTAGGGKGQRAVTEEDKGCLHLLYSNRSMAHLEVAQVEEAMQDAELAIEAKPDFGKAYARRAAVLLDLFKNKEALADLDKAEELDPALEVALVEERERAQGKKWVHNCYLKKRKRLMKQYGCDYVLITVEEDGEGEEVIEPVFGGRYHKESMTLAFSPPDTTGEHTEGLLMACGHFFANSNLCQQVGDEKFKKLLKKQFVREFGPDKSFANPFASDPGLHSSALRSTLYDGVNTHRTVGRSTPGIARLFYPGAPKWVELDKEELIRNIQWESENRPEGGYCLIVGTGGMGSGPPDFDTKNYDECVAALIKYRKQFEGREHKCSKCGKDISDPDPPECLCGMIYCSATCSWQDDDDHQEACMKVLGVNTTRGFRTKFLTRAEQMASLTKHQQANVWTMWYWELVYLGYYPLKDEPDFVHLETGQPLHYLHP